MTASSRRGIAIAIAIAAAVAAAGVAAGHLSPPRGGTAHTVTYVTGGDAAGVTYGPAGNDLQGSVPMRVSSQLGTAAYYAVSAQLQGAGAVYCQILIDGTAVSSASASGGYNLARCEVIRDPSGNWTDANSAG